MANFINLCFFIHTFYYKVIKIHKINIYVRYSNIYQQSDILLSYYFILLYIYQKILSNDTKHKCALKTEAPIEDLKNVKITKSFSYVGMKNIFQMYH